MPANGVGSSRLRSASLVAVVVESLGRSNTLMPFKVTDDSGFLAIIDPDAYRGFVRADWTWETIQEHFRREMRERHLLIWGTGMEHFWSIDVSLEPTKETGFRE